MKFLPLCTKQTTPLSLCYSTHCTIHQWHVHAGIMQMDFVGMHEHLMPQHINNFHFGDIWEKLDELW